MRHNKERFATSAGGFGLSIKAIRTGAIAVKPLAFILRPSKYTDMSVPHGKWHIDTQAVHSGDQERFAGAAVTPIFQSSTYVFDGDTSRGYDAVKYARCNNTPNHNVSMLALKNGQTNLLLSRSLGAAVCDSLLEGCRR